MSKVPEKPLNRSTKTVEKWTKQSEDRLQAIEKRMEHVENRLKYLIQKLSGKSENAKTTTYTIKSKQWNEESHKLHESQKLWMRG